MTASKEDFLAHQQKTDHKNAEQKKIEDLSKTRFTAVKTVSSVPKVPMADHHQVPMATIDGPAMNTSKRMDVPSAAIQYARPNIAGDGAESIRSNDVNQEARVAQPNAMNNAVQSIHSNTIAAPVPPNPFHRPASFADVQSVDARKYVARVSKIPWVATKKQVVGYFDGIRVANGCNGVHFIVPSYRSKQNDAFVEVATEQDYHKIQQFRKSNFVGMTYNNTQGIPRQSYFIFFCGRFLRLYFANLVCPGDMSEYRRIIEANDYPDCQRVLLIGNLPVNCSTKDVFECFQGSSPFFQESIYRLVSAYF